MKNLSIILLLAFSLNMITGCSSSANANNTSVIEYEGYSGYQIDLFYQKMEVINSNDVYNDFLAGLSSISDIPTYDEDTETLIAILSPSSSCSFRPIIGGVVESSDTINVSILREYDSSPETCDPLPYAIYGYNLIKIAKSSKLVNINFEI